MRRDTQIGIILGVVMLVVIGVFLSTRPSVKEPIISDAIVTEEDTTEIEEIDIRELINESKIDIEKKAAPKEEHQIVEITQETLPEKDILAESSQKDDALIEGKWEGVEPETVQAIKDIAKIQIPEKGIEDLPSDIQSPSVVNETTISNEYHAPPPTDTLGETIHKVIPNDSLFKIAKKYYDDESKWEIIYEANKDKIASPDTLLVGQKLLIPDTAGASKKTDDITFASEPDDEIFATARTHTVRAGDTLYNIAKSYYGNPNMWKIIFDANEDKLEDKGLLEIGQTLVIPNKQ